MGRNVAGRAGRDPIRYEIVVVGVLGEGQARVLEGMTVTVAAGRSTITGDIVDQAQLRGVIDWLGDIGLELVSVRPVKDATGPL